MSAPLAGIVVVALEAAISAPFATRQLADLALRTPAEGGTNLEEALKAAAELAAKSFLAGAQNRVVLMTDGAANLGDAEAQLQEAELQLSWTEIRAPIAGLVFSLWLVLFPYLAELQFYYIA